MDIEGLEEEVKGYRIFGDIELFGSIGLRKKMPNDDLDLATLSDNTFGKK